MSKYYPKKSKLLQSNSMTARMTAVINYASFEIFREKRIKDILAVDEEKDTITYRQRIIYKFRPDLSNGTEYDRLVSHHSISIFYFLRKFHRSVSNNILAVCLGGDQCSFCGKPNS